jgi:hypothetical protein
MKKTILLAGMLPVLLTAAERAITISPSSLKFGNVNLGGTSALTLTITNSGTRLIGVTGVNIGGMNASEFSYGGITLPLRLSPGSTAAGTITFKPTSMGAASATISVTTIWPALISPASVPLSGSSGPSLTLGVDVSTWHFGGVFDSPQLLQGAPSDTSVITNTGNGNVNVTGVTLAGGNGEYSVTTSPVPPFTLTPGQQASVKITFDPLSPGPASGQAAVASNASGSPLVITFDGTGIHWTVLSWTASTSTGVVGYNVYRGTTTGGPYTIVNSALVPSTSFNDTTGVSSGAMYFYVVTAVDGSRNESPYSNQAVAVIPTP